MNATTCHKCGSENTQCLGSQEYGYSFHGHELKVLDYECDDCQATWEVTMEMTPVQRHNNES
jgi:hypothetical protein